MSLLHESIIETSLNNKHLKTPSQVHLFHPFRLVWLHSNDIACSLDYEHWLSQLRQIVDTVDPFTDSETCINFLKKKKDEMIFLILSDELHQSTIFQIHNLPQVHAMFIFYEVMPKDKQWTYIWIKIKGIFIDINKIGEKLKQETQRCRRDSNTISITSVDLNRLDSSFMYTQLIKEVIIEMEDDDKAKKELIQFCRKSNIDAPDRTKVIDEFEQSYHIYTPVWWYTRDYFIYDMINKALRLQQIDVIIQTRFYIRDLHKQIEQLYEPPSSEFTVYRGQGLSYGDFEQLRTLEGGLYSFHNFLSTSCDREVAFAFASSSRDNLGHIGIIFHINVRPASRKFPSYALLNKISHYKKENEYLFTMHTVFRVGAMKQLDNKLWQLELFLTNDDDQDLRELAENIRQATQGSTGWDRLGQLLMRMKMFDKAKEVFEVLIKNSSENDSKGRAHYYHLLGSVKESSKDYEGALMLYEKALEIYQSLPDSKRLYFGTLYNDIGSVYQHKKEYLKALKYHQMALNIQRESNPLNNSDLVITYGNLAEVHKTMKHYSDALQFYQKKLNIHKKSIPFNYLTLAITYENIAEMNYNMGKYSEALKLFRKVSKIRQHRLSRDNTEISLSYNNIGKVHEIMEDYIEAIVYYQYACDILQKSIPVNYAELAMISNRIAQVYKKMEEPLKALKSYQETLRNLERSSHSKERNLATVHDNIGQIYQCIGNYKQALYSYRNAIQIERQSIPQNDSQLWLFKKHLVEVQEKFE